MTITRIDSGRGGVIISSTWLGHGFVLNFQNYLRLLNSRLLTSGYWRELWEIKAEVVQNKW